MGPLDALILDADLRQSLVAVRSLGRRGLRVGACDTTPGVPAFRSRWCAESRVLSPLGQDSTRFVDNVVAAIETARPAAVFASHDGAIDALVAARRTTPSLNRVALAPDQAMEIAVDKGRTLELAGQLGLAVPRSAEIAGPADVAAAIRHVGLPAVVKPMRSWVTSSLSATRVISRLVVDEAAARAAVAELSQAGGLPILQEWATGRREAVWTLFAEGTIWAQCAQVAHRMIPLLGGTSVVRESIAVPDDAGKATNELIAAIGLEGFSEVEFRRNAAGESLLMEINPRLSASIELAVRSGVDFPYLMYRWMAGEPLTRVTNYRLGVRMRWLAGDLLWLADTIKNRTNPEAVSPRAAVATFAGEFARRSRYDYVDGDDLRPVLVATRRFIASIPELLRRSAR
jgi:predicted ATP-grasp superfamily ATP-dependent carboligase